ncbi:MAG: peptide chain release factor N(5)-glutamine methyltransferase [Lachnospiraceae bacterium]|nr:peptide chain release factor N(5)-glutamine methyltransferase [Lachnospiraceae bacterium]
MRCAQEEAKRYFLSCGIEDAAVDAWYLMEFVTGVTRAGYLADRERRLSEELRERFVSLVNQRGAHIPLQHLTGEQEFMGLPFLVNEHVLIPRQDTETLVELALSILEREIPGCGLGAGRVCPDSGNQRPYRALDLCTGSGCIAISLEKQWEARVGGSLELYASDLSAEALATARENTRRLGAAVHFIQSDLFAQFSTSDCERFDMIVSNPPYICTPVIEELSEEVRLHEPRMALDGGADGLDFYRRIICESRDYLQPGGWLLMEIGYDQGEAVSDLMRENEFAEVRIAKDLPGNDRVVSGRLPRTKELWQNIIR